MIRVEGVGIEKAWLHDNNVEKKKKKGANEE